MPHTVFFSWQADTENTSGRNLIERALDRAVRTISQDTAVEPAVRDLAIDRDTLGVGGQPPIVDTIFRKIDKAAVFVPDLTFIGHRPDGRPTPNPNVLIEYGWALKSLTHSRIVPVMNIAFGKPAAESMPFNMRHLRYPITYDCPSGLDQSGRKQVQDQLCKDLERALRLVVESDEFRQSLPKPPEPPKYVEVPAIDGRGRFRRPDEPIGLRRSFMDAPRKVHLSNRPAVWFRVMPIVAPNRTWSADELEKAMHSPPLPILSDGWGGYDNVRGSDGYGIYAAFADKPDVARAVVFGFTRGELWSIDTYWLEPRGPEGDRRFVPNVDASYHRALIAYGQFLQKLGMRPPFRWIAGMEDLRGRQLYMPTPPGMTRFNMSHDGECLDDMVCESGTYSPSDPPGPTLKPFFTKLYEACGVSRQLWQDT